MNAVPCFTGKFYFVSQKLLLDATSSYIIHYNASLWITQNVLFLKFLNYPQFQIRFKSFVSDYPTEKRLVVLVVLVVLVLVVLVVLISSEI